MEAPEKKRSTGSFRKRRSIPSSKYAHDVKAPSSIDLPASDEEQEDPTIEKFDPIKLRDRVVIKLLFDQVVRIEQVHEAWETWREREIAGHPEDLWRVLAEDPAMDREKIFTEAATVYGEAFWMVGLSPQAWRPVNLRVRPGVLAHPGGAVGDPIPLR